MNFFNLLKLEPELPHIEATIAIIKKYMNDPRVPQAISLIEDIEKDVGVKDAITTVEEVVKILTATGTINETTSTGNAGGGAIG
jgi:capsule polysaccharide export protein KpsE/RkpR